MHALRNLSAFYAFNADFAHARSDLFRIMVIWTRWYGEATQVDGTADAIMTSVPVLGFLLVA